MDMIVSLLAELWGYVKGFSDMNTVGKIAAVVMVLIALWKSSALAPLWEKLGNAKVLVAPILAIALSLVQMPWNTADSSWVMVLLAGLKSGALAMGVRALIAALEDAPWVGEKYKTWLGFFDTLLLKK